MLTPSSTAASFVEKAGQKTNNRVRRGRTIIGYRFAGDRFCTAQRKTSTSTEPLLAQAARWDFSSAASHLLREALHLDVVGRSATRCLPTQRASIGRLGIRPILVAVQVSLVGVIASATTNEEAQDEEPRIPEIGVPD